MPHATLATVCKVDSDWRRRVVMATDASYLENIHAQAILELQAGFRPGFAPCLQGTGKSFQDTIYLFDYWLF